jgi:parallel beta-helix repeat protein
MRNHNGINIYHSSENNLIKNNSCFINRDTGINLYQSGENEIINNNISSNIKDGVLIFESNNNLIQNNNFGSNKNNGIVISGSLSNSIYHNNFIDNGNHAKNIGNNLWDDGKYGNYWDDYEERYPDALIKQWPDSRSRTITRTQTIVHPILHWLLERFPLLERLLNIIFLKINII